MANIALIPARGGSKRLPGKNILELGGKPLIAWTIEAALHSECFDHVIVSTDDVRIAEIARKHGAEVPFLRPRELSGDAATSDSVVEHAVDKLETDTDIQVKMLSILQPTSPFRTAKHIQESYTLFIQNNADAVISVGQSSSRLEICNYLPQDNSLRGFIKSTDRTQDMRQLYQLNGAIYTFGRALVGNIKMAYSGNCKAFAYVMDERSSIDIDTLLDFQWANFLVSQPQRKLSP